MVDIDTATQKRISDAVSVIEAQTSAEIVPMVVKQSTSTGHVPLQVTTMLLLLYFGFSGPEYMRTYLGDNPLWLWLELIILIMLGLAIARIPWVQRRLTPLSDQMRQVNMRAELEFFEAGLDKTAGSTGVLLFLSLFERRAVVLADKNIASQLPPEVWNDVVSLLVSGVGRGDVAKGFIDAIHKTGQLVIPRFPPSPENPNELKDSLIIKN